MSHHDLKPHPFNPRPVYHHEQDPRIDGWIARAARMLSSGFTEVQIVAFLVQMGAQEHEAVNACRAGAILNEP